MCKEEFHCILVEEAVQIRSSSNTKAAANWVRADDLKHFPAGPFHPWIGKVAGGWLH